MRCHAFIIYCTFNKRHDAAVSIWTMSMLGAQSSHISCRNCSTMHSHQCPALCDGCMLPISGLCNPSHPAVPLVYTSAFKHCRPAMGASKLQRCIALLLLLAASAAIICSAAEHEQPTATAEPASAKTATAAQQAVKRSTATNPPLQQAASKVAAAPVQQAVQKSSTAPVQTAEGKSAAAAQRRTSNKPNAALQQQATDAEPADPEQQAEVTPASTAVSPRHPVSTNTDMPQQVMPPKSDVLICDGIERTIVVPIQVSPYTLPIGMSCSRANGGVCAALKSVVCLPYTDINGLIGPVTYGDTQANSAPLLVHPDNPLVFTMERGYYMTYVSWTVYDVGTGGARMVAKYPAGSSIGPDMLAHNWTQAPGTVDGAGNCDACSDCNLGKGIKDMRLKARPGTGYSSFELSQLFGSPRCGKSCFDLDGSYWTGMAYSCVKVGLEKKI
jgi:hypothetical protein